MSRGLGSVQRAVLDLLREAGGPCDAAYLSAMIGQKSHSLDVSVRRAVRTLRRRGIVDCALARGRLVAWLPEHEPPMVHRRVSGYQIEALVLERLREWTDWCPVRMLVEDLALRLRLDGDRKWLSVAIRRAIRHIRTRGQVHETRGLAGDWLVRRTAQHLGTREA